MIVAQTVRHEHQRAEGASAKVIVVHIFDLSDDNETYHDHRDKICADDYKIDRMQLIMDHIKLPFLPGTGAGYYSVLKKKRETASPGFVGTDENNFIAAIQLCIRAGRYDAGGTAPDSYDCRTCRLPEMQLAEIPSVAIPSLWNAENIVWQGIVRLNRKHGIVKNTAAQIGKLV